MRVKGQSAMEFIFTYSVSITIIGIAIALVFILLFSARTILPSQCSFNGGFACSSSIFTINSVAGVGSQLFLIATDLQPGVINISTFNAFVGNTASTSGFCVPNVATAGQSVYCIANLAITPQLGTSYFATFNITGNYCPGKGSQLYNYTCPITSNYVFGGNLQVQAASTNLGLTNAPYYTPVTLTNTANALANRFAVQTSFVPNTLKLYESNDLGNIRFYDGARELYSWCQSGCTSTTTGNAVFWVASDRPLAASATAAWQIYFLPKGIEYDGVYAGEGPNLSRLYGQYDNGKNVFQFYDSFISNTLSTTWTQTSLSANAVLTPGSGLIMQITGNNGGNLGIFASFSQQSSPQIVETYAQDQQGTAATLDSFLGYGMTSTSNAVANGYGSALAASGTTTSARRSIAGATSDLTTVTETIAASTYYTPTLTWSYNSETITEPSQTANTATAQDNTFKLSQITQTGIEMTSVSGSGSNKYDVYWFRIRSGVAQPSVTVSSNANVIP